MTAIDRSFLESVEAEFGPTPEFSPCAYYNSDGDCIEFMMASGNYYAKRIDGWVTIYYSEATEEMIGGFIKGVRHNLLKRFPGVKLQFEGNTIQVACLLQGPFIVSEDEMVQRTYKDLIEKCDELTAELQTA